MLQNTKTSPLCRELNERWGSILWTISGNHEQWLIALTLDEIVEPIERCLDCPMEDIDPQNKWLAGKGKDTLGYGFKQAQEFVPRFRARLDGRVGGNLC